MTSNQPNPLNTIAFQGAHGAYSEAAAFAHFGSQAQTIPCDSFEAVFEAVGNGRASHGILPIENSLAGSIHRNYDLLMRHDLHIVGEEFLHVHHCLIGLPGADLSQIRTVISHPQALAQCEHSLKRLQVRVETGYDTAGSVKQMAQRQDPTVAAVASRLAAETYGMQVLQEGIEDDEANFTRFLAVAVQPVVAEGETKTSIVFALHNEAGAMFKALSVFALRNLDLTKLESRPHLGRPWEYLFYIDFVAQAGDAKIEHALRNLAEFASFLRVLGSYPRKTLVWAPKQ